MHRPTFHRVSQRPPYWRPKAASVSLGRILILKPHFFHCDAIADNVRVALDSRTLIEHATSLGDAEAKMAASTYDLLISDVAFRDGDLIDALATWGGAAWCPATFVSTIHLEERIVASLAVAPICGLFDESAEHGLAFRGALQQIVRGEAYASLHTLARLADALKADESSLTVTEQLVLCAIGDGSDNRRASAQLGMAESTVRSVREQLHSKLHVQHKGELVRKAAQLGYVYISAHGVVRPGWQALMSARKRKAHRRDAQTTG